MRSLGKTMQLAGLTNPLLAIIAQLNESISQGQMLMFLVASICLFGMGRIVDGYGS